MPDAPAETGSEKPQFAERHYTVAEIAAMWNLSDDLVRREFENEPGVLAIERNRTKGKRRHLTLRIPEHVVERVYRRRQRV